MFMPWELPEFLDGEMVREGWGELQTLVRLNRTVEGIGNAHLRVSALEMAWYSHHLQVVEALPTRFERFMILLKPPALPEVTH
jgi:hypothetical protein